LRLRNFVAVVVLFSACVAARADSVYNFESTAQGTSLPLTLTNNGLTATFDGDAFIYNTANAYRLISGNAIFQADYPGAISVSFSETLSSLTVDVATSDFGSAVRALLYENGVLVGSDNFDTAVLLGDTFGEGRVTLSGDFNGVSFVDTNDSYMAMDNFDAVVDPPAAAVTPELSSIALLGTGMLSVAGMVRRRVW
jgi:hypothetical protein